jgi:hypothetical protein
MKTLRIFAVLCITFCLAVISVHAQPAEKTVFSSDNACWGIGCAGEDACGNLTYMTIITKNGQHFRLTGDLVGVVTQTRYELKYEFNWHWADNNQGDFNYTWQDNALVFVDGKLFCKVHYIFHATYTNGEFKAWIEK